VILVGVELAERFGGIEVFEGRVIANRCLAYEVRVLCHQRFRSEEHTSELQSLTNIVCRLLLEKKQ